MSLVEFCTFWIYFLTFLEFSFYLGKERRCCKTLSQLVTAIWNLFLSYQLVGLLSCFVNKISWDLVFQNKFSHFLTG